MSTLVSGPFKWRIPGTEREPGADSSTASGPTSGGPAASVPAAAGRPAAAVVAERAERGGRPEAEGDKL